MELADVDMLIIIC